MKIIRKIMILTLIIKIGSFPLSSQEKYHNHRTMAQMIDAMSRDHSTVCSAKSLVKTDGGKDIWLVTIGTGDKDNKPAFAVLGGIEGNHILGKEIALGFASTILKNQQTPEIKELLNKITFYVLPDISPDATEQFFAETKYERVVNTSATDDDKDFSINEDPYEDLNNDGYITHIRVRDPSGIFTKNKEDQRIMTEAELTKGESGGYSLYSEGFDNDKDGRYNEDGEGGVNLNRNLTYNYEEFGTNAGLYPVSEPETKAVLDFLYERFNIYATFAFGPQDNLGQPMKSAERPAQGRKITSITKSDEIINKLVSDRYHEITGGKGAPVTSNPPGNFMEWSYFHYGRYSFSTPAWWFPVEKDMNAEVAFLKFAEKNRISDVFIPWREIKHPDFPGKETEVGGIKPFAMMNPPEDTLGDLISANYKFIATIAALHPELEFLDVETEDLGENVFRISLKIHNKGIFATCAETGNRNIWTKVMRLTIEPGKGQTILSGLKVQNIQRLEGDQSEEFSWLISGKGNVTINAGAINTGTITTTLDLR